MLKTGQIENIVDKIKKKMDPLKIFVFGSYVYGTPTETSDLDILVVKKKVADKRNELINIKKDLISKDYSLDILLYSEQEYKRKKEEGWNIFEIIEKKGKLYCAA